MISNDKKHGIENCYISKAKREKEFPLDFFQNTLRVDLISALTTEDMDRKFVFNAICNKLRHDKIATNDVKYGELNNIIAGFFTTSVLERLMWECKMDVLESHLKVFKNCKSTEIRLDLKDCENFNNSADAAEKLLSSFPPSIQILFLRINSVAEDHLCTLTEDYMFKFPKMKELTMEGITFTSNSIAAICSCLDKRSSIKLRKLGLINCNLNNTDLIKIFQALNENESLKKLKFTKNKISPHNLLKLNKRFPTIKIEADNYQTPNVRQPQSVTTLYRKSLLSCCYLDK